MKIFLAQTEDGHTEDRRIRSTDKKKKEKKNSGRYFCEPCTILPDASTRYEIKKLKPNHVAWRIIFVNF